MFTFRVCWCVHLKGQNIIHIIDLYLLELSFKPRFCVLSQIYIHIDICVDFELPSGKMMYETHEDRGYMEICLMLISDYQTVLRNTVSVTLTPIQTTSTFFIRGVSCSVYRQQCELGLVLPSAEPGLDYSLVPSTVEFLAGSEFHTECTNISILADGLVEADESFSVLATVNSPDSVQFVSEDRLSAIVDVIIRDDDGKTQ